MMLVVVLFSHLQVYVVYVLDLALSCCVIVLKHEEEDLSHDLTMSTQR